MMIIIITLIIKCLTEAHYPTESYPREQGGSLAEPGLVWDGWVQETPCHAKPVPSNQKKLFTFQSNLMKNYLMGNYVREINFEASRILLG